MRVAALYDIHGNLPALEAVLEDVAAANVDLVIVGGDVVAGPMPRPTLARLLHLDQPTRFLRGNADREVAAEMLGASMGAVPEAVREITRWTAQQLDPADQVSLAGWPMTIRLEIDGLGVVLFCHATPRDDSEVFTRRTPAEWIASAFKGVDAALVVCGHTHMQFDRMIGTTRVVNAGSVGMPYGNPGAYWLLLDGAVQFQHTPYDLVQASDRIRAMSYPQAYEFAGNNVLHPPSEDEALAVFETMISATSRS